MPKEGLIGKYFDRCIIAFKNAVPCAGIKYDAMLKDHALGHTWPWSTSMYVINDLQYRATTNI